MNHFHFTTSEVEKTADFYTRFFGFRTVKQLGKTRVLKNSSGFILALDEGTETLPIPEASHIGFTCESDDRLAELFVKIKDNPENKASAIVRHGSRAAHFYCKDPSGNGIEVGWYNFG